MIKIKDMCLYALFALFIAVGAFIKIPLFIVPITLQTLFVLLAGLIMKEKAIYSVLLYIAMGLLGLPVFTSGGGIGYVVVPTFGYLIGFLFCSWYVGHTKPTHTLSLFIRCFIGILGVYIIGMIYFVFIQYIYYHKIWSASWLFVSLFLVYLPGDILSIIAALSIHRRIQNIQNKTAI